MLYQPEIPQNTGNIVRTCAATGSGLHLIRPLGFAWDDAKLKRAGLDYWTQLDIRFYDGWDDFTARANSAGQIWTLSTHGTKSYADAVFGPEDYLVFGQETAGLPPAVRTAYPSLRVPMRPSLRSLNLSNTVALVLYEALRQNGFAGLR